VREAVALAARLLVSGIALLVPCAVLPAPIPAGTLVVQVIIFLRVCVVCRSGPMSLVERLLPVLIREIVLRRWQVHLRFGLLLVVQSQLRVRSRPGSCRLICLCAVTGLRGVGVRIAVVARWGMLSSERLRWVLRAVSGEGANTTILGQLLEAHTRHEFDLLVGSEIAEDDVDIGRILGSEVEGNRAGVEHELPCAVAADSARCRTQNTPCRGSESLWS